MTLSNKASDELDDLLHGFYQECEGEPLEVMRPDGRRLPSWIVVLLIVGMCVVFGGSCAQVMRFVL